MSEEQATAGFCHAPFTACKEVSAIFTIGTLIQRNLREGERGLRHNLELPQVLDSNQVCSLARVYR